MIRLSKSFTGEEEQAAVARVMKRGFFGMGEEVLAFEQELAAFLGVGEVVCVNTGTSAIHLALQALGVGPGDEVIVPTITYVATFQAISATGATAVACDVEEGSLTIDIEDAKRRITEKTKAIVHVYYAGKSGSLRKVYKLAERYELRIVEDAAQAFGCRWSGILVGAFGDTTCFSFDGVKNITSGEGGAIVSRDEKVIKKVKAARLLGVEDNLDVTEQGWRYQMSDLFAAIGREQLKKLVPELAPKRIALAQRYQEKLSTISGLIMVPLSLDEVVPYMFPIRVMPEKRDALRAALLAAGIQSGRHYKPNHLLTRYGAGKVSLPTAERLYTELLTLPLHPEVSIEDQDKIIEVIKSTLQ
jgi:dTDP-4-amino-4,6-dideoxygalactose transaminase